MAAADPRVTRSLIEPSGQTWVDAASNAPMLMAPPGSSPLTARVWMR